MRIISLIGFAALFILSTYAQTPLYNIGVSTLRGVTAGIGEAYRIKEQYSHNEIDRKKYGTLWHDYAMISGALTVGIGIAIAEYSSMNFWKLAQGCFTAAAFNFFFFQTSYNLTHGEAPFRQSEYTTSRAEVLASFPVMSALLMTAIILEIVL